MLQSEIINPATFTAMPWRIPAEGVPGNPTLRISPPSRPDADLLDRGERLAVGVGLVLLGPAV
jgi:hypothetical protein